VVGCAGSDVLGAIDQALEIGWNPDVANLDSGSVVRMAGKSSRQTSGFALSL
jgi:hypothetical protein